MTTRFYRRLVGLFKMRPDFIIIGAQKSGTTSLYEYLTAHPGIAPARMKEVHFFDEHFYKGLDWYWNQFPSILRRYASPYTRRHGLITGEASPYYLIHPFAPKRVHAVLPHCKFIAVLRNPIDRAFSNYKLRVRRGRETRTFEEAVETEDERLQGEWEKMESDEKYYSKEFQQFSYLARGKYAEQLERWFALFPREQFLILESDAMLQNPQASYDEVLRFLGVPPHQLKSFDKYNSAEYSGMNVETRARLREYFALHNARLYELLGRDFGWD